MNHKIIHTSASIFTPQKTHTPEEILAAGGAAAFGKKSGKSMDNLIEVLKKSPEPEPFTDAEWENSLQQLLDTKA